jgi:hypothetical protein
LTVGFVAQYAGSLNVIRTNGLLMIVSVALLLALRPALRVWDPQEEETEERAADERNPHPPGARRPNDYAVTESGTKS